VTGYAVTFAASAKKELKDLPSDVIEWILEKVRALPENPRPPGCRKLQGYKTCWRIRIGQYRVVYDIDDAQRTIDVTRIAHRKEVYEP
jgi:mRNA interferase RelE/StbE